MALAELLLWEGGPKSSPALAYAFQNGAASRGWNLHPEGSRVAVRRQRGFEQRQSRENGQEEDAARDGRELPAREVQGQNDIYSIHCITEESTATVSSPFLEASRKQGLEALYMVDSTDEFEMQRLKEVDDQKLKSTTNDDEDEKKKVLISSRTADSPCVLATSSHGWSANMERTMKAQGLIWLLFDTPLLALSDRSMNSHMHSLVGQPFETSLRWQPDGAVDARKLVTLSVAADEAARCAPADKAFPGCSRAGLSGLSPQRWTRCA